MSKLTSLALAALLASSLIVPAAVLAPADAARCFVNVCGVAPPSIPPGNTNPPPPGDPSNPVVPPGGTGSPTTLDPSLLISCEVKDGSTDLIFRNSGKKTISEGMPIRWVVAASGQRGAISLSHDLPPGGKVLAADLLKIAGAAVDTCVSKLL
jgi:hypothetical protein